MSGIRRLFNARRRRIQAKRETKKNLEGIAKAGARIERNQATQAAMRESNPIRRGKRIESAILAEGKQRRRIKKNLKKQVPRKFR